MIRDSQLAWLEEFLIRLCNDEKDRIEVEEIVDTFNKLWRIAKAAEQSPFQRSPRLEEALIAIRPPPRQGLGQ